MHSLSNMGTYVPLSANTRVVNQSEEFWNSRIQPDSVWKKSSGDLRTRRDSTEFNSKNLQRNNSKTEKHLHDSILPLIEGATMYKKFSTNIWLQKKVFDPLNDRDISPDMCGYGVR